MTVQKFFAMLESANEFKTLIGEQKTTVCYGVDEPTLFGISTYTEFEYTINSIFAPDVALDILMAEVVQMVSVREFKINFTVGGVKQHVKLFVQ